MCTNRVIPAKNVDGNQTGSLFVDQVRLCGCLAPCVYQMHRAIVGPRRFQV